LYLPYLGASKKHNLKKSIFGLQIDQNVLFWLKFHPVHQTTSKISFIRTSNFFTPNMVADINPDFKAYEWTRFPWTILTVIVLSFSKGPNCQKNCVYSFALKLGLEICHIVTIFSWYLLFFKFCFYCSSGWAVYCMLQAFRETLLSLRRQLGGQIVGCVPEFLPATQLRPREFQTQHIPAILDRKCKFEAEGARNHPAISRRKLCRYLGSRPM